MVVLMGLDFEGVSREDVEALSNDMGAREPPSRAHRTCGD